MKIKIHNYYSILGLILLFLGLTTVYASDESYKLPRPTIAPEFNFNSQFVDVLGSNIHYVEQGSGDPVLFIHGNPTSSYLWRNIIPYVSSNNRAIALDLIGMGKSDNPDIEYRFQDHYAYLEKFIDTLHLENITLVVHDWGAALGFEYARRHPDNVVGISFFEGALPPIFPSDYANLPVFIADFFKRLKDPVLGPQFTIEQNGFVEEVLPSLINRTLSETEMAYYRQPYLNIENRKSVFAWTLEVPIEGQPQRNVTAFNLIDKFMRNTELPILLLYGSPGVIVSPEFVSVYTTMMRNIETVYVGQGLHYLQEDQPDAIGYALVNWLRRNNNNNH